MSNWGGANRPITSNKLGSPNPREGSDGDMQVRQTNLGAKIFAKVGGRWHESPLSREGVTKIGANISDYLSIDSDSVDVFKNGSNIASFGKSLRIGKNSSNHSALRVASDGSITIGTSTTTNFSVSNTGTITSNSNLALTGASSKVTIHASDDTVSYDQASAIFLGLDSSTPKFSIKGAGASFLKWDGSALTINGAATLTSGSSFSGLTWNGSAIDTDQLAADAITTAKIADDAVTNALIATDAVNQDSIAANSVTASEIVAGTITATEIASGTITTTQIASGTIVAGDIAGSTITGAKIASSTIEASNIASNTITASQIAADTITIDELAIIADIQLSGIIGITGSTPNIMIGSTLEDVGQYNIGIGTESIGAGSARQSDANHNIGIGFRAAKVLTTGDKNICIGYEAGDNITTGNDNVIIGGANAPSATGSDQLVISSGDGGVTWITGTSAGAVTISGGLNAALTGTINNSVGFETLSQQTATTPLDQTDLGSDDNRNNHVRIGSFCIAAGSNVQNSDASTTIAYGITFTKVWAVTCTRIDEGHESPMNADQINTTNFTVDRDDGISGKRAINWIAVGTV